MSSYLRFLLKKYRALLQKARSLLRECLKSENPDVQAKYVADNYKDLFVELEKVSTEVHTLIEHHFPETIPDNHPLEKTYLRHSILLLDAVDRNLEQLKDRALKDVFQKHVGDQIQAFLKEKDG